MGISLGDLASLVDGRVVGDPRVSISAVGTLEKATAGQIGFLSNHLYAKHLLKTKASAVILSPNHVERCPTNALVVKNPYLAYAKIASRLYKDMPQKGYGIAATAVVDDEALVDPSAIISDHCVISAKTKVGPNVVVGAGTSIGESVVIGSGTVIQPNVSLYPNTVIGVNCIVHAGAVIGSDGFGIVKDTKNGLWLKVPQLGRVTIGDNVEIGANTTIDRGAIDDTVIENNVRLDNQIQVAHNVYIGEGTAIAGCVGIAGSTRIGKRCLIGGGVGLAGHLEVTDDVIITGMTLVTKSINTAGVYSSGIPAKPDAIWKKTMARVNRLGKNIKKTGG